MAKKDDNDGDEPSAAVKEAEARSSSIVNHFTRAKSALSKNIGGLTAQQGSRTAAQALRPAKDMPIDQFSAGSGVDPALHGHARSDSQTDQKDGDEGDDGSGTSGKGGDTGGGPVQKPAPDSGYVSFAGATDAKVDAKAQKQNRTIEQADVEQAEKMKQEGPDAKAANKTGVAAPKAGAVAAKAGAPTASGPGKSGGGGAAPAP